MEANELRIGNIVADKDNDIFELSGFYLYQLSIEQNTKGIITSHKPIPLTAEWFEKFGYYDVNMPSHFIKDEMTIDEHRFWNCNGMFIDDKNGVRIKYVHQLQNLYFALQQKELKIINQE
jgi:hypothetical protein